MNATRRLDLIIALLLAAALAMWASAEAHLSGPPVAALLLGAAFVKGRWVIRDFMGLAHSRLRWRALVIGWLAVVLGLIGAAYWMGL